MFAAEGTLIGPGNSGMRVPPSASTREGPFGGEPAAIGAPGVTDPDPSPEAGGVAPDGRLEAGVTPDGRLEAGDVAPGAGFGAAVAAPPGDEWGAGVAASGVGIGGEAPETAGAPVAGEHGAALGAPPCPGDAG